jgi:subtilisin family serine protease
MRLPELLESRWLLTSDICQTVEADHVAWFSASGDDDHAEYIPSSDTATWAAQSALDAGESLSTARNLGVVRQRESYFGFVGGSDARDVMRIELESVARFDVHLSQLSADLDLYLLDSRGRMLARSTQYGSAAERIVANLQPGTYHLVVSPYQWFGSTYQLTVGAEPLIVKSPQPIVEWPQPPSTDSPLGAEPALEVTPDPPLAVFPDVPYFGGPNDWNLNAINAPEVWAQGFTGQGITVAVVDTGVDLNHSDLVQQLWVNPGEIPDNHWDDDGNGFVDDVHGWDFVANDASPDDFNGHGTHVAGTIAASRDGRGVTGVAPNATILPVRVLDASGSGQLSDVAAGIRYAIDAGADIINLSLGGGVTRIVQSAIEDALRAGVLVVAAAGNESAAMPAWPARFSSLYDHVISVGASSRDHEIAGFSNRVGLSQAAQVDAPGVGIYSAMAGGGYARLNGTSMAAPHVAGLAALALSAQRNLSPDQIRALIVEGANQSVRGSDSVGGINAARTVAAAAATSVGVVTSRSLPVAATDSRVQQVASVTGHNERLIGLAFESIYQQSSPSADVGVSKAIEPVRVESPQDVVQPTDRIFEFATSGESWHDRFLNPTASNDETDSSWVDGPDVLANLLATTPGLRIAEVTSVR